MAVTFPKKSGIIQNIIRILTTKVNNISKSFKNKSDSKVDELKSKIPKLPKFDVKIASMFESPKFEDPVEYVINSYPNGIQVASESTEIKKTLDCELAMRKFQDKLDEITKLFEDKAGELDKMLEPIQELVDPIQTYLGILTDFINDPASIIIALPKLIDLIGWMFGMMLKPYFDTVDPMYKGYREIKIATAMAIMKLDSLTKIKCVVDCKYKSNQSKCPVLVKLGMTTCPLLNVLNMTASIGDTAINLVDSATMPIDTVLTQLNNILGKTPINKVIRRQYPPVIVRTIVDTLTNQKSVGYGDQEGVISQPDVSSEIKTKDK